MKKTVHTTLGLVALAALVTLPSARMVHAGCGPHGGFSFPSSVNTNPVIVPVTTGKLPSNIKGSSGKKGQQQVKANAVTFVPALSAMASLSAQQSQQVFNIFFPSIRIQLTSIDPTMMSLATRIALDAAGMGDQYGKLLEGYADFSQGQTSLSDLLEEAMGKIRERQKNDKDFSKVINTVQANYGGLVKSHLAKLEAGGAGDVS